MSAQFEQNFLSLVKTSPATAVAVRSALGSGAASVVGRAYASSGDAVVELGRRALDSRRDPREAAERAASAVSDKRVVVAGFGTGYLVEALVCRGIEIVAVVESSPQVLAAAMCARDLEALLAHVPVILTDQLRDPVQLASLRAKATAIVPHGPSVVGNMELGALVERWSEIRVANRRPRVMVVGPIAGGSLGVARSTARALEAEGCDTRFFDASQYADAYEAFDGLDAPLNARRRYQGELAALIGQAIVSISEQWRPDLLVALAQAPLDPESLDRLRSQRVATAFWFVENCRVLTYWQHMASAYDWFYAIQPGHFLDQLADAGSPNPAYLPVACDPDEHKPVQLSSDQYRRYAADVSFAGSAYLNRRRIFATLTDLPVRLWGPGWTDTALAPLAAEGGRSFDLEEMVRIFAASRINLNLHSASHVETLDPNPDYVNPRTFELASCGAFQLSDVRDPLPDLFRPDEVVTFTDVRELRELIAHFLARDDERVAVVSRARTRALAEHTYAHRVRRMMHDTLSPELIAAASARLPAPESLGDAVIRMEGSHAPLKRDEALTRAVHEIAQTMTQAV